MSDYSVILTDLRTKIDQGFLTNLGSHGYYTAQISKTKNKAKGKTFHLLEQDKVVYRGVRFTMHQESNCGGSTYYLYAHWRQ
jgi:hypothetical protein